MEKPNYYMWLFSLWFAITVSSCTNNIYQRDMIKKLDEIKMEIRDGNVTK